MVQFGGRMKKIILASASPRRKEILKQIYIDFDVIPSNEEENISQLNGYPEEKAEILALAKAREISKRVCSGLIIGADTIVVLDNVIFGKPKDEKEAFEMLSNLSGREHYVITAIAVIDAQTKDERVIHEKTKVTFVKISSESILAYINTKEPFDKAGAYAIQGIGALFVEKIEGCYFNVVGLPIVKLNKLLKEFGFEVLK